MATFNIYVQSYRRANAILTYHSLEYCTDVVRKSEEGLYRAAGIENIWAIQDDLIDSCGKVTNYLLDNAPEDVICIVDDDIEQFYHRLDTLQKIESKEEVTREIERLAQLAYDMGIGYACCPIDTTPKYYDRPFKFVGVTGGLKIFNRTVLENRVNLEYKYLSDIDFELKELMEHRIILIANYFCNNARVDTNEGGNNGNKSLGEIEAENQEMSLKWGKYYKKADGGSAGKVKVVR